jgi:hypothetical protein
MNTRPGRKKASRERSRINIRRVSMTVVEAKKSKRLIAGSHSPFELCVDTSDSIL